MSPESKHPTADKLVENGGQRQPLDAPVRLVIVDDHSVCRLGVRQALQDWPSVEIIGEGENGFDAITLHEKLSPDVLVIDYRLPGTSGLEASETILARNPEAKIVLFTAFDHAGLALRAINLGIKGFLAKGATANEMVEVILQVSRGSLSFTSEMLRAVELLRGGSQDRLSIREEEILRLLTLGYATKEIADRLDISRRTVEKHKFHISNKLNLHTTGDLIAFALRSGLIGINELWRAPCASR